MEELIGKHVLLFGGTFYYSGTLESVQGDTAWLSGSDARIVYETGRLDQAPDWKTAERVRKDEDDRPVGVSRLSCSAWWAV